MTTANLSVGIKTDSAKAALRELKQWAKGEMKDLVISVSADSVVKSIKASLGKQAFDLKINTEKITSDVRTALTSGFTGNHRVHIDAADLTDQVKRAIAAGSVGVHVTAGGGTAPAASTLPPSAIGDIKGLIRQVLTPAVDELAKAATLVGASARKIGAGNTAAGPLQASGSYARTDPATGERIAVRRRVEDAAGALAGVKAGLAADIDEVNAAKNALGERAAQLARIRAQARADALNETGGRQEQLRARRQAEVAEERNAAGERAALFAQRRNQERGDNLRATEEYRSGLRARRQAEAMEDRNASGERAAQFRAKRNQERGDDINAAGLRAEQLRAMRQIEAAEARNAAGERAAQFRARRNQERGEELNATGERIGQIRARRQAESMEERNATGERAAQIRARRDQDRGDQLNATGERISQIRARRQAEAAEERNATGERAAQFRARRNQERGDELNAAGERIGQVRARRQAEAAEERNATGERAAQFRARRNQERGEELNATGERVGQIRARRQAEKLDELNASGERAAQLSSRLRAERDAAREMRNVYNSAKSEAATDYTPRGQQIMGAMRLQEQYGRSATSRFINNDALMSSFGLLDNYKRKTSEVTDAHRKLNASMNEAHAGARGLAGSMGALWLTYGSMAPLLAGAAIGGALVSVFNIGKDVEYQLKFVQVLSASSAVSMREFGDAVRGSMTLPTQAAEGMRALAQNGLDVQQSLTALPNILRLATAGEMTLTEAALGATGVMAAFNLQVDDLGRVGDVFAKAAALSNTSVSGMVEAMKKASTVSDLYHVSLEETAATLAVMAKRNITGTSAGTAFTNMMTELATPQKKARDAMASLHLEIYNGEGQLKSYGSLLTELRDKTILLNEKGKLEFMSDVFGERGGKAINALLTDFDLYGKTLDELKNKSKGFAQSVTDALGETTSGKLKLLMTEFQLTTAEAFNSANGSVNHFIDTLRVAAGSTGFKKSLDALVTSVSSVTSFLIDNAKVVGITVAAWVGFKVLDSVIIALPIVRAGFAALTTQVAVADTAMAAFGLTARAAMGALTGGIALVVAFGIEYLLLRDNTDKATVAQKNFSDQLALQGQALATEQDRLTKSNDLLARRITLLREGKTAAQVDELIKQGDTKKEGKDYGANVERALADVQAAKAKLAAFNEEAKKEQGYETRLIPQRRAALQKEVSDRENVLTEATTRQSEFQRNASARAIEDERKEAQTRLTIANDFNKSLAEKKAKQPNLKVDPIDISQVEKGDRESYDRMIEDKKASLNAQLGTYSRPDPSSGSAARRAASEAHSLAISQSQRLINQIHLEDAAMRQSFQYRKELEDAKYGPNAFGPYMQSVMAEQRAITETATAINSQRVAIAKLRAAQNDSRMKPPDREAISKEIDTQEAKLKDLQTKLTHEQRLATVRGQTRDRDDNDQFAVALSRLQEKIRIEQAKTTAAYSNKTVDKAEAAGNVEAMKVEAEFSNILQAQSERLVIAQRAVNTLKAEGNSITGASYLEALRVLGVEESRLATVKEQMGLTKNSARQRGISEFEQSQTAQYGWEKFWNEYQSNGQSSAMAVYDTMKFTTNGMANMMTSAAVGGAKSFKAFAASVAAEATKIMMTRAIVQLLGLALNLFGGVASGGSGMSAGATSSAGGITAGGSGGYGGISGGGGFGSGIGSSIGSGASMYAVASAGGNVMTPQGPMALQRFANGGIGRSPMVSIFAEGRMPEAYVPLPDGRSIPVTVSGGGGGGGVVVSMNITIAGDGKSKVQSDTTGDNAKQLGDMLSGAVTETIAREKRPGGLLYGPQYA